MAACNVCGAQSDDISQGIGLCVTCMRSRFNELGPELMRLHRKIRRDMNLPGTPPMGGQGLDCARCVQGCRIPEGGLGYCGAVAAQNGALAGGDPDGASCRTRRMPAPETQQLPFPYTARALFEDRPEKAPAATPDDESSSLLAVFYTSCSYDCLFCQYTGLIAPPQPPTQTAADLAARAGENGAGIVFCGGTGPNIEHSLKAAEILRNNTKDRPFRIFWDTTAAFSPDYMEEMARLALDSGGGINIDYKAWSQPSHFALCGDSNLNTLKNTEQLAEIQQRFPHRRIMYVSIDLLAGYIEEQEIKSLARLIEFLDPEIPLTLNACRPGRCLADLPVTSRDHAEHCREVALSFGLRNVRIGNPQWLQDAPYRSSVG